MKIKTPKFKRNPLAMLVALSVGMTAGYASAQEQEVADEDKGLETIIITAQKRAQNLQEVPVAVTAINGSELAESVIKDVFDLRTNVPSLATFQSQSSTNSSFAIRGVGTSSQNFGLESSVGLYVDNVFRSRQNSIINNLVDIDSVEVLRGPQGTLFGKNTPSGAISIGTKAPNHDGADGFFEATLGNFDLRNFSAATNISAIEDVLAFRITGFTSNRSGFVDDINFGEDSINNRDRYGVRLQALYTPSDDLSVRVILDKSQIDEICCAAATRFDNNRPSLGELPGIAIGQFGTDAILAQAGLPVFTGDQFFDRRVSLNSLPIATNDDRGLSVEINYNINEKYSFTSISAVRKFESFDQIDSDFSAADFIQTTNDAETDSFSQELRLDYNGDKFHYIAGLYYFEQDLELRNALTAGSQLGLLGGALAPLIDGINAVSAATGGLLPQAGDPFGEGFFFPNDSTQDQSSYALFAQFDYEFAENWTVTAGLRYTNEDKDILSTFTNLDPNGQPVVFPFNNDDELNAAVGPAITALGELGAGLPPTPGRIGALLPFTQDGFAFVNFGPVVSPRPDIDEGFTNVRTTGTIKISYQPNRNTLVYGSFGTGFKSGGTNTDRIAFGFDPVFDPETSETLEFGIKKDFPKQALRINAAVHITEVDDFQANTFQGTGFNLQNAGTLESSGGELEITWRPSDTWSFDLIYSYIDATYDEFDQGSCFIGAVFQTGVSDPGQQSTDPEDLDPFCSRAGDTLSGAPEHTATLQIRKDFELPNGVYGYALYENNVQSDTVLDGNADPLKVQGGFGLTNIRVGFTFEDIDMDVTLWGRNVFDKERFGNTTFDVPIQAGRLASYFAEPRTFGVTVQKRF
ncbi:TonB-dependent receptor [Alteromonadaceae bacterium M269]|nr:TonB-dependent receptor [Alteromonadaceae bacterium M269]